MLGKATAGQLLIRSHLCGKYLLFDIGWDHVLEYCVSVRGQLETLPCSILQVGGEYVAHLATGHSNLIFNHAVLWCEKIYDQAKKLGNITAP